MTPQELKNSILQLAIQGKLVDQRPEEGTAEELYHQIQKEEIETVKKNPEFGEDEIPFDIPDSWKLVRIENIAILYNGRAYKQNELLEKGKYPVLRVGNLFTNNKWYYSDLELEPDKYVDNGDLLYSWSASFGPYIWTGGKVIYHYHIWKIQFSKWVDKKFLYYFLLADTERIKRSGHGLAMIHVTKAGTEKRTIPLPPLAEQKRIVAKIEELLPLIVRYEQAWTRLEDFNKRFPTDMQKSLLQLAIQGKLVPQRPEEGTGEELYRRIQAEKQALIREKLIKEEKELPAYDEPPFDIPDSWFWAKITDCGAFISGFTPKPEELCQCGIIPYFKVSDMNTVGNELWLTKTEQYLKDPRPKKFFLKNTIVYPKNGGAVFTNKKRILAQDSIVDLNTGGYTVIGPVDLQYIYLYFSLIDFRQCYKGTALPTIDMDKLKKRWLPLPPLAEQKRIVAKLESILPLCDRLRS